MNPLENLDGFGIALNKGRGGDPCHFSDPPLHVIAPLWMHLIPHSAPSNWSAKCLISGFSLNLGTTFHRILSWPLKDDERRHFKNGTPSLSCAGYNIHAFAHICTIEVLFSPTWINMPCTTRIAWQKLPPLSTPSSLSGSSPVSEWSKWPNAALLGLLWALSSDT